jgi:hypothetical protein
MAWYIIKTKEKNAKELLLLREASPSEFLA